MKASGSSLRVWLLQKKVASLSEKFPLNHKVRWKAIIFTNSHHNQLKHIPNLNLLHAENEDVVRGDSWDLEISLSDYLLDVVRVSHFHHWATRVGEMVNDREAPAL